MSPLTADPHTHRQYPIGWKIFSNAIEYPGPHCCLSRVARGIDLAPILYVAGLQNASKHWYQQKPT